MTKLCETCLGKVEHSNASDWSIFHRKPERDHLEEDVDEDDYLRREV